MGIPVLGISVVRKVVNSFSFSGVLSGQRDLVTVMSRSMALSLSLSVSTRPVNQITPKTGVVFPFGVSDSAALAVSTLPSNFSGWG